MFEKEDTKKQALDLMKEVLDKTPLYQNLSIRLIILATIFSFHLEQTRYPDSIDGKIPSELFNESNPLISRLNRFNKHIEDILKGFTDVGI